MKIAIIGGTGPEGSGLGIRWAHAGHDVIIGSRVRERAEESAAGLNARLPAGEIRGLDNAAAAAAADVVVLAVPYGAQEATLAGIRDALAGKLLVTVVAPTGEKKARVHLLPSGLSAAEEAQAQLGEATRVVAAFQNIGAHYLTDLAHEISCDVLVCGDRKEDKELALQLCADAGMRGVNAGALQNARAVEGITSILIAVNIIYKVKDAGLRITGID